MGGGKKQNQRTKGNVKPSSSSRAAEILVQDGNTGFIGFGGLSGTMGNAFGYVPKSFGGREEGEHDIDSELRMLMRKMGKKDTVTRLKAVQEFTYLCSHKQAEEIMKVLSFWPRIYSKLSEDYDHRVREATQLAHLEIVTKAGRKLAPQLKMIISSWLRSQFDQYPPAASTAKKAFDVTFPGEKKRDALSFCKKDLLSNINDILIKQTKDTISDPRSVPEEEREAKYNRIIASTLLSLGYIMEVLTKEDNYELSEQCQCIFHEKKFWKFSKHNSPMIRSAFFSSLSSACQFNADALRDYSSIVCPTVLCCLDESNPTVVGLFWESLLHVLNTFKDSWTYVNARKAVLPKLWLVLRKGGFGNAAIIFPNILPFLSKVPQSVIGEGLGFPKEFFTNMKQGLSTDKVVGSHSESIAVISAYMECLRYMLFYTNPEKEEKLETETGTDSRDVNAEILEYLINEELKFLVDSVLEDKHHHWRRAFLVALKDLIFFIEKHEKAKIAQSLHAQTLEMIHSLLYSATISVLTCQVSSDFDVRKKFKNLEGLIKTVVFNIIPGKNNHQKQVLFVVEETSVVADEVEIEKENIVAEVSRFDNTKEQPRLEAVYQDLVLTDWTKVLLKDISSNCIELLFQRKNILYMKFLSRIISCVNEKLDFENMLGYMLIAKHASEGATDSQKRVADFLEEGNLHGLGGDLIELIIQPIMDDDFSTNESYWSSPDCQLAVIDLLCKHFILVEENRKLECLLKVTEISTKPFMLCMFIEKVLSTADVKLAKSWFDKSDIWLRLISFASAHSAVDDESDRNSAMDSIFSCLELCMFHEDGLLCEEEQTERLFTIFKNILSSHISGSRTAASERALSLIGKFYRKANPTKTAPTTTTDLLLTVFQFIIKMQETDNNKVADLCLKSGIESLLNSSNFDNQSSLENLLQKIAYWVQESCDGTKVARTLQGLAACTARIVNYMNGEKHSVSAAVGQCIQTFIVQLIGNLRRGIEASSMHFRSSVLDAVLLGHLSITNLPTDCRLDNPEHFSGISAAYFAISLMNSLESRCLEQGTLFSAILDSLVALCSFSSLDDGLHQINEDDEFTASPKSLELNLKELLSKEPFPLKELLNTALDRSLQHGGIHVLAFERLCRIIPPSYLAENPISDMLGCAMSHNSNDSSSVDGLKMTLTHLEDSSITRAMVEQFVDQLGSDVDKGAQGFNDTLDLCTTIIIHWQNMLQHQNDKSADFGDVINTIIRQLIDWRDNSQDAVLFSVQLSEASDVQLALDINLMRLLSFILDCGGAKKLDGSHWDFILCSLASWIQTCEENASSLTESYRKMLFAFWALTLCTAVSKAFEEEIRTDSGISSTVNPFLKCKLPWIINTEWRQTGQRRFCSDGLLTEWQEFFTPAIFKGVYLLYREFSTKTTSPTPANSAYKTMMSQLLNSTCCAVSRMPSTLLLDILLDAETVEEQLRKGTDIGASASETRTLDGAQMEVIQKTFCLLLDQLQSEICCLQVLAHTLLCKLMIVSRSAILSMTSESVEGDECDTVRSLPDKQYEALEFCQEKLLSYLDETSIGFGSYLTQAPSKELSQCFLAFLLSWQITLYQFRDAEPDQRAAFANFFRKRNMTGPLLKILFSILPHDKGHLLSADPVLIEGEVLSLRTIRQCSFHVYLSALECIPAVIRSWCNNNLDKKSASILERFTTSFASPVLCSREIEQVSNSSKTFVNMAIKTRPAAREVVALYTVEEISMELVVKMSQSHPLGPVVVECGKRVGVSSAQWRQWMLQLTMYLTQQNGTIVDGLSLWKKNVDKKFEGVEECMICFSVVHGTNYQLPTITCRVCKKKYHSACLYKWFSTSNKSTCPLCRNSF